MHVLKSSYNLKYCFNAVCDFNIYFGSQIFIQSRLDNENDPRVSFSHRIVHA